MRGLRRRAAPPVAGRAPKVGRPDAANEFAGVPPMIRREGETLKLEGALTLDTVSALILAAEEHIGKGTGVIDFAAVTEVDSAAVALALEWVRQAEGANVALRLLNMPVSMQNLAKLYGVSELLQPAAA